MAEKTKRRRKRRRTGNKKAFLVLLALVLLVLGGVKLRYALAHRNLPGSNVSVPDFVTVDYIPTNEYSRPGTPLREISGVVVHYVGNPGTTAAANRSFFANLALTHETYASAHFVVGLEGEILQCVPLTEKKVVVMPTKTVPQGISALLNFNPENSEEQLEADMKEAISHVHTAMVTYAARDSDFDGHIIHAGEYLALMDGALLGSYTNIKTLFKELSWAFDEIAPEFITVYYGKDVQEDDAQEAAKTIIDCFPDAEVSVVSGGQPVYYYMISVE